MTKISVFTVLVAILYISDVQSDNCWSSYTDVHGFGGSARNVTFLSECQSLCISDSSCVAIDWDPSNSEGKYCWTLNNTVNTGQSANVTHYVLSRFGCPGSTLSTGSVATIPASSPPGILSVSPSSNGTTSSNTATNTSATSPITAMASDTRSTTTYIHQPQYSTVSATTTTSLTHSFISMSTPTDSTNSLTMSSTKSASITVTTTTTVSTPGRSRTQGTSYVIVFPPKPETTNAAFQLIICTPSFDDVAVEIQSHNVETAFYKSFTVSLASCQAIEVPTNLSLSLSDNMSSKYVTVTASNYVSIQLTIFGSCTSYTAIPESLLGTDYYISTLKPFGGDSSIVTITAIADNTEVIIIIESVSGPGNVSLSNGTVLQLTSETLSVSLKVCLERGQTYQLSSVDCDLSGSNIHSSKPVSVTAGNLNAFGKNYVVIQFPPTTLWGRSYIAATLPNTDGGYYLKVISSVRNASVVVDGILVKTFNYAYNSSVFNARPVLLSADNQLPPILVIQYPVTVPAAIILPSVEHYRPLYNFLLPQHPSLQFYVLLAVQSNSDITIILRKETQDATQQLKSINTTGYYDGYFGRIGNKPSYLLLSSSDNLTFGAYVYAFSDTCSLGYPLSYSVKDTLIRPAGPRFRAQTMRPAYIVLAGLGGGCILLIIVAVFIICSYPIQDDMHNSSKKPKRKNRPNPADGDIQEQEMSERNHQAEVETNPYYQHSDDETATHQDYSYDDNNSAKVEDNPYFNSSDIVKPYGNQDDSMYANSSEHVISYHCSEDATAAL